MISIFSYLREFTYTVETSSYHGKKTYAAIYPGHRDRSLIFFPLVLLGEPRLSSDLARHLLRLRIFGPDEHAAIALDAHRLSKRCTGTVAEGNIRSLCRSVDLQQIVLDAEPVEQIRYLPRIIRYRIRKQRDLIAHRLCE